MAAYFASQVDPGIADREQIAAGVAQAEAAVALAQTEARTFFESYGDAVTAGHADVNAAGRQGDPDLSAPDAADRRG